MSGPEPGQSSGQAGSGRQVDYERGTLRGWPRAVVRWLLLQVIRPFIRFEIVGLDHVPPDGAFLFVANHLHNADPLLLETALKRPVHFMAKKELFRYRPVAWGLGLVGAFPVDRGRSDRTAIRQAEARLASGVPVGMFPEGTRSTTGALQHAFPGAGLIAVRSQTVILPAAIVGTESLPFNGVKSRRGGERKRFRRSPVTMRIGEPFALPAEIDGARVNSAFATDLMMNRIAWLLPVSYRGAYAEGAGRHAASGGSETISPEPIPATSP